MIWFFSPLSALGRLERPAPSPAGIDQPISDWVYSLFVAFLQVELTLCCISIWHRFFSVSCTPLSTPCTRQCHTPPTYHTAAEACQVPFENTDILRISLGRRAKFEVYFNRPSPLGHPPISWSNATQISRKYHASAFLMNPLSPAATLSAHRSAKASRNTRNS